VTYLHNPKLRTIKTGWLGTPTDQHKRFKNIEHPFTAKTSDVLKWMLSKNPQRNEKKHDNFSLIHVNDLTFQSHKEDCIVWLGHASFFVRLNGINMLIDPVFFTVPLVKRYTSHAFTPEIFKKLHYLIISHDHQDHCQQKSIRRIVDQNPDMQILTGLNMETLLRPWSKNLSIQTAGWYQQYETGRSIEIYFMPSRHWSKRGLKDENMRLWGAFVIRSKQKTIYFSGDSGYGSHFSELHTLFQKINVAIIGIGAYKPEWFMRPNHVSPQDALRAFHDMQAEILIPMHYGTFDISDEPVGEPLRILQGLEQENKINGHLVPLNLGENFTAF
jgi:L-ascorbate metabolism protein UlaG (beta-lactamase superfamily)